MTLKFPTRRLGEDGKWIHETPPVVPIAPVDPAVERQASIDYMREIWNAKSPNGKPAYMPGTRERARQRLEELGEPVSN